MKDENLTGISVILEISVKVRRRQNSLAKEKKLYKEAMRVLKETSRTFYIPIKMLDLTLRKTVGSAYLCMRAIDEIEDHEKLDNDMIASILRQTSDLLKEPFDEEAYLSLIEPHKELLPEVTIRLGDWIRLIPSGIVETVQNYTSIMARGMADWAEKNWHIKTEEDLDDYTYYVAGLVGEMLSDIWKWYDGTETDLEYAVGFGRGLQAVNILRNQEEDLDERGVNFVPEGWGREQLFDYARKNLSYVDGYIKDISNRRIKLFCKIPSELAKRTLAVMESGREKMTREEVEETVKELTGE